MFSDQYCLQICFKNKSQMIPSKSFHYVIGWSWTDGRLSVSSVDALISSNFIIINIPSTIIYNWLLVAEILWSITQKAMVVQANSKLTSPMTFQPSKGIFNYQFCSTQRALHIHAGFSCVRQKGFQTQLQHLVLQLVCISVSGRDTFITNLGNNEILSESVKNYGIMETTRPSYIYVSETYR